MEGGERSLSPLRDSQCVHAMNIRVSWMYIEGVSVWVSQLIFNLTGYHEFTLSTLLAYSDADKVLIQMLVLSRNNKQPCTSAFIELCRCNSLTLIKYSHCTFYYKHTCMFTIERHTKWQHRTMDHTRCMLDLVILPGNLAEKIFFF